MHVTIVQVRLKYDKLVFVCWSACHVLMPCCGLLQSGLILHRDQSGVTGALYEIHHDSD